MESHINSRLRLSARVGNTEIIFVQRYTHKEQTRTSFYYVSPSELIEHHVLLK